MFGVARRVVKASIPFLIALGAILFAALVWSIVASWGAPASGIIGFLLLLVVILFVRIVTISLSKTPLLDIDVDTNRLNVYNYRSAGASIPIEDIAFFLGLHTTAIGFRNAQDTMVAYAATRDGGLRFITSSVLTFQDFLCIEEGLRMLGYVCDRQSLKVRLHEQSSTDREQTRLSEYLVGGTPSRSTQNLGDAISPGGRLNVERLLAEATIIFDPSNAETFIARNFTIAQ